MSWLARSIANSLKLDDDDENNNESNNDNTINATDTKPESDQHSQSSSSPSSTTTSTPRGVKEDLSEFTKTLTRQFWGVASLLAPPPDSPRNSNQLSVQPDPTISHQHPDHPDESNEDLISGIRSDFAEIGGRFKSGISKLSSNKTVSEITKIASNFLQIGSERDFSDKDLIGMAVGVTEEAVAFARDIAMHPETWLDFPLPDDDDFDDLDMSDVQQEHALAVEQLAPRLAALRMELCPGYMSEACFWKIYFVLLHPRLSKSDAELLSTPQIVAARAILSQELQKRAKAKSMSDSLGVGTSTSKETADLPHEEYLSVPSRAESESVPLKSSGIEAIPPTVAVKTSGHEAVLSSVAAEVETEKHPVQSTEMEIIDKAVIEEKPVNSTKHQYSSSSSSSRALDDKFEDDGEDWLKEEIAEMVGKNGATMTLGNDEDVSFSDLEEDDSDVSVSHKKVVSGSSASMKDSRDWVQLSRTSTNSVKDINPVSVRHAGSEQVSVHNSETKESSDWLDVDDIDVM